VAAVSLYGGRAIATQPEAGLPDGLRAVVVELTGWKYKAGTPRRKIGLRFTPLDATGRRIREFRVSGSPLSVTTPVEPLSDPAHPGAVPCAIEIGLPLAGLAITEGRVATSITPHRSRFGRPYLSCASTRVEFENSALLAAILVDAARPGAMPAALPAMRALSGHPGVYQAPGFENQMLARRIPGGWLVVQGEGVSQRLTVLEHLRAEFHP
jgi:hypothetical protein